MPDANIAAGRTMPLRHDMAAPLSREYDESMSLFSRSAGQNWSISPSSAKMPWPASARIIERQFLAIDGQHRRAEMMKAADPAIVVASTTFSSRMTLQAAIEIVSFEAVGFRRCRRSAWLLVGTIFRRQSMQSIASEQCFMYRFAAILMAAIFLSPITAEMAPADGAGQ